MKYLLLIVVFASALWADSADRINASYRFDGSTGEILCRFKASGSDSLILSVLFDPKHVVKYAGKTNLKIRPLKQAEHRNSLEYKYNYLVANLLVEMKRERSVPRRRIDLQLVKYVRSSNILPLLISVQASYEIISENGEKYVEYRQKTVMDKEINRVYQVVIKRDVRRFLQETLVYLDGQSEKKIAGNE